MSPTAQKPPGNIKIVEDSIYPTPLSLSHTSEKQSGSSDVEQGKEPQVPDEYSDFDAKKKQVRP
jgi:hypothetical protein